LATSWRVHVAPPSVEVASQQESMVSPALRPEKAVSRLAPTWMTGAQMAAYGWLGSMRISLPQVTPLSVEMRRKHPAAASAEVPLK
jgi:hypothetical protein